MRLEQASQMNPCFQLVYLIYSLTAVLGGARWRTATARTPLVLAPITEPGIRETMN